ncbi:MAG: twin-arginine translocase TatA/TatE family subunit [Deltaproteobacteria bacterium]|nr:twin-arginine translocase TatA/TatE family subunit [Deltaproteobacteria bacterium]
MDLVGSIVPGFVELAFLLVILVVVFGARRLPALGEAIGRAVDKARERHAKPPAPGPKT